MYTDSEKGECCIKVLKYTKDQLIKFKIDSTKTNK